MFEELITRLQSEIKTVLDPILPSGARVALFDYPYHANVGDSLIWLGEIEYLKYRRCKISYCSYLAMHTSNSQFERLENVDVILLHGGGNFGTLWPQFQKFREAIIQRFPHKKIIQFPQSVYFDNEPELSHTLTLLAKHKGLTVLARDNVSFKVLQSKPGIDVRLCPDMAFMLGTISASKRQADKQLLYLSRQDKEKLHLDFDLQSQADLAKSAISIDWLEEAPQEKILIKLERKLMAMRKRVSDDEGACLFLLNAIAHVRKQRGIKILSRGNMIVTDRLHAHILSVLLGKKNLLLDNNNNKLGAFYHTWMLDTPGIHFLDDVSVSPTHISEWISTDNLRNAGYNNATN